MNHEEWIETCRERGRNGGLKAARLRRQKKAAEKAAARKPLRYSRPPLGRRCPDCGGYTHLGICLECDD